MKSANIGEGPPSGWQTPHGLMNGSRRFVVLYFLCMAVTLVAVLFSPGA